MSIKQQMTEAAQREQQARSNNIRRYKQIQQQLSNCPPSIHRNTSRGEMSHEFEFGELLTKYERLSDNIDRFESKKFKEDFGTEATKNREYVIKVKGNLSSLGRELEILGERFGSATSDMPSNDLQENLYNRYPRLRGAGLAVGEDEFQRDHGDIFDNGDMNQYGDFQDDYDDLKMDEYLKDSDSVSKRYMENGFGAADLLKDMGGSLNSLNLSHSNGNNLNPSYNYGNFNLAGDDMTALDSDDEVNTPSEEEESWRTQNSSRLSSNYPSTSAANNEAPQRAAYVKPPPPPPPRSADPTAKPTSRTEKLAMREAREAREETGVKGGGTREEKSDGKKHSKGGVGFYSKDDLH